MVSDVFDEVAGGDHGQVDAAKVDAAAEPKSKRQKLNAAQCLDEVLSATAAREVSKPKPKADAKKKPSKDAKKKPSKDMKKRPAGAASFSVEWTRDQVLCRTGKKGVGQSHALVFNKYGGLAKAVAKAKKWVQEQNAA